MGQSLCYCQITERSLRPKKRYLQWHRIPNLVVFKKSFMENDASSWHGTSPHFMRAGRAVLQNWESQFPSSSSSSYPFQIEWRAPPYLHRKFTSKPPSLSLSLILMLWNYTLSLLSKKIKNKKYSLSFSVGFSVSSLTTSVYVPTDSSGGSL